MLILNKPPGKLVPTKDGTTWAKLPLLDKWVPRKTLMLNHYQKLMTSWKVSQKISMPEYNGQIAIQSRKSEIKLTAVHAGPSVPSKPWVTEFVLLQAKPDKTKSQLKTWLHAVTLAVWDVTEVIQKLLGNGGKKPVLSLVIFSVIPIGAKLIPSSLVTITQLVNTDLAQLLSQLQNALLIALLNTNLAIPLTNTSLLQLMVFHQTLMPSKPKSTKTDQLKLLSMSMKISSHTRAVFINTLPDPSSEDTPLKLWVGVLKIVLLTG